MKNTSDRIKPHHEEKGKSRMLDIVQDNCPAFFKKSVSWEKQGVERK